MDITNFSRGARVYLPVYVEGGKLVFQVFASVAEFERYLIRERTMAGLEATRTRGRNGGRKREMMGPVRATKMGPVPQPRPPRGAALRSCAARLPTDAGLRR